MALAENALTTVAAVSALGATQGNSAIETAINQVSQEIEDLLGRQLQRVTYTSEAPDYYQGSGRPWLLVNHYPIVSVSQALVNGSAVTDYVLIPRKARLGMIWRNVGWPKSCAGYGDLTRDVNHQWADFNIQLAYTAGYITPGQADEETPTNLPESIQKACGLAVIEWLERGLDGNLVRERTPGGWERQWSERSASSSLSAVVQSLLAPYRLRQL